MPPPWIAYLHCEVTFSPNLLCFLFWSVQPSSIYFDCTFSPFRKKWVQARKNAPRRETKIVLGRPSKIVCSYLVSRIFLVYRWMAIPPDVKAISLPVFDFLRPKKPLLCPPVLAANLVFKQREARWWRCIPSPAPPHHTTPHTTQHNTTSKGSKESN